MRRAHATSAPTPFTAEARRTTLRCGSSTTAHPVGTANAPVAIARPEEILSEIAAKKSVVHATL
jgi:hypothetical protein